MPRICVYTAIMGDYDELKPVVRQSVACDWICFADRPGPEKPAGWTVIETDPPQVHPRMRAKFFKLLSHEVFPCGRVSDTYGKGPLAGRFYDYLVWIDGSIRVKSPTFVEELVGAIGRYDWAMFKHPDRDCVYDEVVASRHMAKYANQPLERQVAEYRSDGFPAKAGLMACGVIARRTRSPTLAWIGELWWRENVIWSYQDQLSLPYVLWKTGYGYDRIDINLWKNDWFNCIPHKSTR
ncbi:glycosyltransferase domain-containing protein [Rhodoplanes sp. SY1]|uniref:glycosyltransferase domain-containing protein n=1 Tax=Rhodoplanes sp. SY1 TaxID=3166646 RepID=UPI0038B53CA5